MQNSEIFSVFISGVPSTTIKQEFENFIAKLTTTACEIIFTKISLPTKEILLCELKVSKEDY